MPANRNSSQTPLTAVNAWPSSARQRFHSRLAAPALPAALCAVCTLLLASPAAGEQLGGDWPCQVVQMPANGDLGTPPVVTSVCLQPGGALLAAGGDDHQIYLWDVGASRTARRLVGHEDWVHAVKFSADGRMLASAGHDGRVMLWDPATAELICVLIKAAMPSPNWLGARTARS